MQLTQNYKHIYKRTQKKCIHVYPVYYKNKILNKTACIYMKHSKILMSWLHVNVS